MVDKYAVFINCTPVVRRQTLWWPRLKAFHFSWLGLKLFVCCLTHRGSTGAFRLLRIFSDVVWHPGITITGQLIVSASPHFTVVEIRAAHTTGQPVIPTDCPAFQGFKQEFAGLKPTAKLFSSACVCGFK